MTFIKNLVENKLAKAAENSVDFKDSIRIFQHLTFLQGDGLTMSVQANAIVACKPQITLENLNHYTHWEVALMKNGHFLSIEEVLPKFSSRAELELYETDYTYYYVPTDLVEELYLALKETLTLEYAQKIDTNSAPIEIIDAAN